MKVLLVNGSSRKTGCTNAALCEVERALNEERIETEHFFIGNEALPDCIACRKCRETGSCVPSLPFRPEFAISLIKPYKNFPYFARLSLLFLCFYDIMF